MAVHYFDPDPSIIPLLLKQKYKVPALVVMNWLQQMEAATPPGTKPTPTEFAHEEWVFELRLGENGWEVESLHKPTLSDTLKRQAEALKS